MDAYCINCHYGGSIDLTNYAGVKKTTDKSIIINSDTVDLMKSISYYYSVLKSSKNMPSDGKLDDCSIKK